MAFLTESRLASVLDLPVALAATEIKQGDWLVVATVKITAPMILTVRSLTLHLLASSVTVAAIGTMNRVKGGLGLAYLVLRKDYLGGDPGASGALENLNATDLGIFSRDTTTPLVLNAPGTYTWLIVNNMKADATSLVPPTTSIDFKMCVTGQVRLDLSNA